jgi:electron transport complex protein RnfB
VNSEALADRIDDVLPQTQCTRCGYAGCRPYAEAIALGAAPINRCPPGGDATIAALASLTGQPAIALDPACGVAEPQSVATIDEAACIGCTLCIDACPIDAIIGAPKRMHAVLSTLCSGCALCVAPCPVDCIAIVPTPRAWTRADAEEARERHRARAARRARNERIARRGVASSAPREDALRAMRQAAVGAALARARARRAGARR